MLLLLFLSSFKWGTKKSVQRRIKYPRWPWIGAEMGRGGQGRKGHTGWRTMIRLLRLYLANQQCRHNNITHTITICRWRKRKNKRDAPNGINYFTLDNRPFIFSTNFVHTRTHTQTHLCNLISLKTMRLFTWPRQRNGNKIPMERAHNDTTEILDLLFLIEPKTL